MDNLYRLGLYRNNKCRGWGLGGGGGGCRDRACRDSSRGMEFWDKASSRVSSFKGITPISTTGPSNNRVSQFQ